MERALSSPNHSLDSLGPSIFIEPLLLIIKNKKDFPHLIRAYIRIYNRNKTILATIYKKNYNFEIDTKLSFNLKTTKDYLDCEIIYYSCFGKIDENKKHHKTICITTDSSELIEKRLKLVVSLVKPILQKYFKNTILPLCGKVVCLDLKGDCFIIKTIIDAQKIYDSVKL